MKAVGKFIIVQDDEVVQKNELGLIMGENVRVDAPPPGASREVSPTPSQFRTPPASREKIAA